MCLCERACERICVGACVIAHVLVCICLYDRACVVARMCVLTSLKKDVKSIRPAYIPECGSHVVFVLCALFLLYSRVLHLFYEHASEQRHLTCPET